MDAHITFPRTFVEYRRLATARAQTLVSAGKPGEFDEQALPAYSHRNPLMRWLFWQRLRLVSRYLERTLHRGARVLDFGCGVGMLLPLLAQQGHRLTGIDLDIRHTTQFLASFGVQGVTVLPADHLEHLPAGRFDAITALDVLEHVPNLEETLGRLGRVLVPGGRLLICGPTENSFYKLGRWLAGFSGDYHVRNIEDIRQAAARQFPTRSLTTLYPGLPLFRLFESTIPASQHQLAA